MSNRRRAPLPVVKSWAMSTSNRDLIVEQFTRQAVPYSKASGISSEDTLMRVIKASGAGPDDTVLDVACGPGLLVCAFAPVVRHVTGIDLTPAMLDRARELQRERGLQNVSWQQGDVHHLPYTAASFSIVSSRFAFHHFPDQLAVLREMRRVCKLGGRIVVSDTAPAAAKLDAFNEMERLRDPSHVRALSLEEHCELFARVGLSRPRAETYRMEDDVESLLQRSFTTDEDANRCRKIFADALADDFIDMQPRLHDGKICYAFPVAVLVADVS